MTKGVEAMNNEALLFEEFMDEIESILIGALAAIK